jgi:ketoreductase RED2
MGKAASMSETSGGPGPASEPVVIVTGSSGGIGAAIARRFAADGARIVVNSARSVAPGKALAEELGGLYVQADVSAPEQAANLIEEAVARFGRLDALVNCAGTTNVIPHDDLDEAGTDVWLRILAVNVLGPWATISSAVPHLRRSGCGQIINITSTSGSRPAGSSIPYAVSKAALNHMTLLLAKALGPDVRVNAVAPGLVDTQWTADWHEAREFVSSSVALRRPGRPEDVAEVCAGVARASYMTGAVVPVDGGLSLL